MLGFPELLPNFKQHMLRVSRWGGILVNVSHSTKHRLLGLAIGLWSNLVLNIIHCHFCVHSIKPHNDGYLTI